METNDRANLVQSVFHTQDLNTKVRKAKADDTIWQKKEREFIHMQLSSLIWECKIQQRTPAVEQITWGLNISKSTCYEWINTGRIKPQRLSRIAQIFGVDDSFFNAEQTAAFEILDNDSFDCALQYSKLYHTYLHDLGVKRCRAYGIRNSTILSISKNDHLKQQFFDAMPKQVLRRQTNPASKDVAQTGSLFQMQFADGRKWYAIEEEAMAIFKRLQDNMDAVLDIQLTKIYLENRKKQQAENRLHAKCYRINRSTNCLSLKTI